MIYLDNAATSWPKPPAVASAVAAALQEPCGNPGRSGHRAALAAGALVRQARQAVAGLFGIRDPQRIVFTLNATWAINMVLKGWLHPHDHVVTSAYEHNAVARPLKALESGGVLVTKVRGLPATILDPDDVRKALRPETRLVVVSHASNVSGAIAPVADIGQLCREHGIPLLVDAAQTAGSIPIDVAAMGIDFLAFPGHKGLLGPQGTGGLYIGPALTLQTLVEGGTGTDSRSLAQPAGLPERFESGTTNTPGLAGLAAGVRYLQDQGVAAIGMRESAQCQALANGLASIPGISILGPPPEGQRAAVVSITLDGIDPVDAATILDSAYGIATRAGLHCAPDAHRELGTLECGALRFSPGPFTGDDQIAACIDAVQAIIRDLRTP
jgi:cysteine desulfurase family protein